MHLPERNRRPVLAGEWVAGVATGLLMVGALGVLMVQPEVSADVVHLVAEVKSQHGHQVGELPADPAGITGETGSSQFLQNPAGVQLGESFGEKIRQNLTE